MPKACGIMIDRLLRTGGHSAVLFGRRPTGVSSFLLCDQRETADFTRVCTCGAALNLTVRVAEAKSKGAADPAFVAHVGAFHNWALAVWENWAPLPLLRTVNNDACTRLGKAKSIRNVVYGPVWPCCSCVGYWFEMELVS